MCAYPDMYLPYWCKIHHKLHVSELLQKTIPVLKKKGLLKNIEKYRPRANLCLSSKIFEKLFLKMILEIETEQDLFATDFQTCVTDPLD